MKYTLMNKETPVLDIEIEEFSNYITNILDVYNVQYLPIGIAVHDGVPNRPSLINWWRGRSIPASRSGLKDLLFDLNLPDQYYLLTKCYGLSLTDQYWINPVSTPLEWKKINFFDNPFSEDVGNALFGKIDPTKKIDLMSPDNTSDGWLKKKWKIINGVRFLFKAGSPPFFQEPLNELIATKLYSRFDTFEYAKYKTTTDNDQIISVCKNFVTSDTELVSAYQVFNSQKQLNHISNYEHLVNCYMNFGIINIKDYLDFTLTCDYIIGNTDRHFNNFGLIRNVNTLEITKIAPIFDNGTSLWHNVLTNRISFTHPVQSRPFRRFHSEQIELVNSFDKFDINKLKGFDEEVNEILKKYPTIDDERRSVICKGINHNIDDINTNISIRNRKKSIYLDAATKTHDAMLLSSMDKTIEKKIIAVGYKPTKNLIANIKCLNLLLGKDLSIKDLKKMYNKKYKLNYREKLLINEIGIELLNQEKKMIQKKGISNNKFPEL